MKSKQRAMRHRADATDPGDEEAELGLGLDSPSSGGETDLEGAEPTDPDYSPGTGPQDAWVGDRRSFREYWLQMSDRPFFYEQVIALCLFQDHVRCTTTRRAVSSRATRTRRSRRELLAFRSFDVVRLDGPINARLEPLLDDKHLARFASAPMGPSWTVRFNQDKYEVVDGIVRCSACESHSILNQDDYQWHRSVCPRVLGRRPDATFPGSRAPECMDEED